MDIITSANNIDSYKKYLKVVQSIHAFLQDKEYLQIDLPVMSPALIPEGYLEIFETEFQYFDKKEKLYLTPSPELFLKRLIVEGIGDCYYLGKSFRNSEPNSPKHTPEFTMLELYKVGHDYKYIVEEVHKLLKYLAEKLTGNRHQIIYQGRTVSLEKMEQFTVAEAFEKYANITEDELFDEKKFIEKAKERNYVTEGFNYEDLFSQIYTHEVEPHLGKNGYPTVLYDYPVVFASLSKPNTDGRTAQRFEFYIEGMELGNCYTELADWKLQEERFKNEDKIRKETGKIQHPVDTGFIDSLKKGLPLCSGIAIGVDRLAMIFADVDSIDKLKLISVV